MCYIGDFDEKWLSWTEAIYIEVGGRRFLMYSLDSSKFSQQFVGSKLSNVLQN